MGGVVGKGKGVGTGAGVTATAAGTAGGAGAAGAAAERVLAGGAVVWRERAWAPEGLGAPGGAGADVVGSGAGGAGGAGAGPGQGRPVLEVLVVHRPSYDDWSFPKGKLKGRESVQECAVREVTEETGVPIVLGQPLETLTYPVGKGRLKEVRYWAAVPAPAGSGALAARARVERADATEVDDVAWVGVEEAYARLTHRRDRALLGSLVDLWEDGRLATRALVLVRHARAVDREEWAVVDPEGGEATRPLRPKGERRSAALVPLLSAYGVGRVVTSPWERCVATVAPYAAAAGLGVVEEPALTEAAHAVSPGRAAAVLGRELTGLVGALPPGPVVPGGLAAGAVGAGPVVPGGLVGGLAAGAAGPGASVLCLHRPTLPTLLGVVAGVARGRARAVLPSGDPWLRTAECVVVHVARRPGGAPGGAEAACATGGVPEGGGRPCAAGGSTGADAGTAGGVLGMAGGARVGEDVRVVAAEVVRPRAQRA